MPRKPAEPGVDRRQQILESALTVFAERGFEAATNKEIAKRAGVNQGLIYFYFESKADLFFAAFEFHVQAVVAQIDQVFEHRHDEDPVTGFAQILAELTAILNVVRTVNLMRMTVQIQSTQTPQGAQKKDRMLAMGTLTKHLIIRLQEYLQVQIAADKLRPVNTGLVATIITQTFVSSVGARGQINWEQPSQQDYIDAFTAVFCYGLLPRHES